MADAGRQGLLMVSYWFLGMSCMTIVDGFNQVILKDYGNKINFLAAKFIDDFLIAGATSYIQYFIMDLSAEFEVGNTPIGGSIIFNGF